MPKWIRSDGGRATSKRPRQRRDCVVRACATALRLSYDEVYDSLADAGRKCGRSTPKKAWQRWLGERADRMAFPAERGVKRMNVAMFCARFPVEAYVVQIAGHLLAVVAGVAVDESEPRWDACVYAAWAPRDKK